MGSGSSTAGGKNTTTPEQRSVTRALTLPQFHRVIKSTIAEIHSIYLDPTGKVSSVLNDLTHSESYELELLINGCSNSEAKIVTSQLQYAVENIIYEVSGIMPTKGILATSYKSSGIYELIREGNIFPDGYFLQCEIDRLHFDDRSGILHVGDGEAFMLLIGMFITRGFVTTLLLKPVEYRLLTLERFTGLAESNLRVLATVFLYIVRQVSVIRGKANMVIPRELQRFVFTDEEMRPVYGRLTKAIGYGERLLKEWGVEYIRRLRIAQQYEEEYR
ncbi:uncharacterized protein LOC111101320 [Crassostrea virginica]|uniref:Uncharacterized protein LOC111101704 n=1 Tax=Crassostrea virginica TaxID=6565 RepID=A0A8B8AES9_CRAVI|nr:uncharacterized protein LOC111101704 [Crassostrea virginica]